MDHGARRLERGAAAAIALLPLVFVVLRCGLDPSVPFVLQRGDARWIMAPLPVSAELHQWGETHVPVTSFGTRFDVPDPVPPRVRLRIRALGTARLLLNGSEVEGARREASLGRAERAVEVAAALRPGENELRVDVANPRGPALLWLAGEGLPQPLVTDPSWSVRDEERLYAGAMFASDARRDPRALSVETPAEAVVDQANALLGLFVAGCVGFLLVRGRRLRPAVWWGLVLGGAGACWLLFYVGKTAHIPPAVGFDARHHLHYVDLLLETGRVPLATDGWSTYQPPLFYAASGLLRLLGGGSAASKLLPLLSGLGLVGLSFLLARRLAPQRPALASVAALFAATLPMNLYSSAYFSNEALHACLAGAALLAASSFLLSEARARGALVFAALLFGLAALSKFTVLATLPVFLFFLLWKLVLVERAGIGRTLGATGLFVGIFLLLAGWFYARNQLHFGAPVVGNWDLPGEGRDWWLQPGFHTVRWYAGFGEALARPYLSGFVSFWDAVYSTFWGDGFIAGRSDPYHRHDFWNYGFMSAGYWVALPATGLLLGGGVLLLREILGDGPVRLRLALGFLATSVWAVCLAFLQLTLQLPFFAQAKAPYLLMLTPPLALAFATGFLALDGWLDRRGWLVPRAALYGWLTLFAGTLLLAFLG